ncbi:ABC transporter ATP-binding protein [Alicyclobacillus cycloheptanicus]|uniref:Oligopeptide/dipeptide ABC transporter ATP-binding protein n=1 Tax=Alicyclobacillus cycloheptanicus TaxID=1457 RepID=A0ABT9XJJ2_9BACL|nr:ABC transporter ATP-binding protein [Alicyclobacillus cycloheptanicus]MDQ0189886.1 oligopeptide/dipeptide ABC transporter ATP-binding protein [Alicyclobacillus cycloheptanicus]WDM02209.1 ABC transporter ATP-binding protein [Alicyclobacillus cycloheptanicus]
MDNATVLKVEGLSIGFDRDGTLVPALRDVSFEIRHGEIMGLVGESGSGKSLTSLSIMKLLPRNATVLSGAIQINDVPILEVSESAMHTIRGNLVSMIFQEPMVALNPLATVGKQIAEPLALHTKLSASERTAAVLRLLKSVGIPEPERRIKQYPFELSGGMRQRVMIAMALACEPQVIIADEPTTALDVTIQYQILELLREIREKRGTSILLITHDMGVIADLADRVSVMYAGRIVETAPVQELFAHPAHPYTRGLLQSIPSMTGDRSKDLPSIPGTVPDLRDLPPGCPFQSRCFAVSDKCRQHEPPLSQIHGEHFAACWHPSLREEALG